MSTSSMSKIIPLLCLIFSIASLIIERVFRPKKSILINPVSSITEPSYWVTSIFSPVSLSSAVLTVAFVFLVNPFLTMLGTTKETFDYASRYLTIIYLGIPATMLYNLTASLLRSVGDSKTPLYLLLFSSVLNVGLDLLFIVVFKWDVAGAAIATVVSQLISAVLCCIYICFKVKLLLPTKESFTSIGRMVADELKVGCPMGLQNSVISIGMMVLQYFVNQFGSYAVAGYTIGNRVQMLVQNPMNSMSMVIATFAGQNEGAGKYDRIRKGVNYCLILCITYAIAVGALTMLFATPITGIFTSNSSQQTIDYSVQFIFWNCPFEFTLGMLFIYRGTIQGLKNGIIPMIGSLIEVLMRICAPVILSSIIGYISICVAGPAAWTASMLLMLAVYYIKMKGFKNKKALA